MEIIVNQIANLVLTLSGMLFFLMLYGRKNSIVHKWDFLSHWLLKLGLSAFIAGSFFCFLNGSKVPLTQVMSNVGLSGIMTWAVIFHYKFFTK